MAIKLPKQIAIIDSSIKGSNCIAAEFCRKDIAIIFVDDTEHCLTALSKALNAHSPANAIHIVSHGSPGALHLGSHTLNSQSLVVYPDLIRSLKRNLTDQGDILLYGCHIAQGAIGQSFVDTFAHVTHANVAASHSLTAARSLGGNSSLEYCCGTVTSPLLLNNALLETTGIQALNNAPAITPDSTHQLKPINENQLSIHNKGTPLADIIDFSALSDPDGTTVQSIAIVDTSNSHGAWEYSRNNGQSWQELHVKPIHSLLLVEIFSLETELDNTSLIRFIPNRGFSGTASLTFRAHDQSNPLYERKVNINAVDLTDGTSPFSEDTGTITVTVTDTNDAPNIQSDAYTSTLQTVLTGSSSENAGSTLTAVGDINNDGTNDFFVSSQHINAKHDFFGKVTAISGVDFSPLSLPQLQGEGTQSRERYGLTMVAMDDLDKDGYADFAVAAPTASSAGFSNNGRIDIISGQTGQLIRSYQGDSHQHKLGYQLVSVNDINSDGVKDLVAGARIKTSDGQHYTQMRYYSGTNGELIQTFQQPTTGTWIFDRIVNATDINNDGYDELLLGITHDPKAPDSYSAALLISGKDGTVMLAMPATDTGSTSTRGVNTAGDYNHDGTMDFMVSSSSNAGAYATIISGKDASPLLYIEGTPSTNFGKTLSLAGDINFDGINDYLITSTMPRSHNFAQHVGLYSGKDGALITYIVPQSATSYREQSVISAGDRNNDGLKDFLLGDSKGNGNVQLYSYNIPSQVTTESSLAIQIHPEAVTITDDNSHFGDGVLQLRIPDAQRASLSQLVVLNQGPITVTDNTVSYNDTEVGTFSGGTAGTALQITLNTQATLAVTEALIQSLGFVTTAGTQASGLYTLLIELTDSAGATSQALPVQITVTADNDAPELQHLDGDTVSYTIGGPAVALDSGADTRLLDPDSTELDGGILTVTLDSNSDSAIDSIQLLDQDDIRLIGSDVQHAGNSAGSLSGGSNGVPLTIILNSNATLTAVQDILQALHYHNTDPASLNTATRTATLSLSDGDGGSAPPAQLTIELTRLPILDLDTTSAGSGYSTDFTEAAAPVAVAAAGAITASDDGNFSQLQVTLSNRPDGVAEQLSSSLGSGSQTINGEAITITPYDPGTGRLLVTLDSASATTMEQLIATIHYQNTALNPDTQSRSISFIATDNDSLVNTAVVTHLSIDDNNTEPTLSATALNPMITAQRDSRPLFENVSIDTIEPGQTLNGLTLEVDQLQDPGDEYLKIDNQLFDLSISSGPTITTQHGYSVQVTVTGDQALVSISTDFSNSSPAEIQTLLETLHYQHNGSSPTTSAARTVSLSTLTDSGGGSDTNSVLAVSSAVTVHQNQQPDSADTSVQLNYNNSYSFQLSDFGFIDSDSNDQLAAIRITHLPAQGSLTLDGSPVALHSNITASQISAGLLSFAAASGGHGSDYSHFSFVVNDGLADSDSSTLTIDITAPPPPPKPESEPSSNAHRYDGVWVKHPEHTGTDLFEVFVEAVSTDRINDPASQNLNHADIPLGELTDDISTLINIALPADIGLHALNTNSRASAEHLLPFIETLLENKEPDDKTDILNGAQNFLQHKHLPGLQVGQITLTSKLTQPSDLPIIIQGPPELDNGHATALAIDARQLPAGTILQLDNVEFAVVVGPVTLSGGLGENIVYTGSGSQNIRLGPENDQLYGGDGNDIIGSDDGDDQIFGKNGHDQLFGGNGADQLHGGQGLDVVRYDDPLDHYAINKQPGQLTISHQSTPNMLDTLINIEQIQFADQLINIDQTQNQVMLAVLYTKALHRQADLGGFNFWANAIDNDGIAAGEMALAFLRSPEYQQQSGTYLDQLNIEQQIDTLYLNLLGREADIEGKTFWTDAAQQGLSLTKIADHFMLSEELSAQYLNADQWDFFI